MLWQCFSKPLLDDQGKKNINKVKASITLQRQQQSVTISLIVTPPRPARSDQRLPDG